MEDAKEYLKYFIKDLTLLVQRILIEKGVKPNSDLVRSVDWIPSDSGLQLIANDYYEYVSTGRKPRARKIPIENLIDWVKSYGIGSGNVNQIAYAIQQSIFIVGIKGKGYTDIVNQNVAEYSSEELSKVLSKFLLEEMVASFEPLTK